MKHAPRVRHFIQTERLGIKLQSNAVNKSIRKQYKYKVNVAKRVANLRQVTRVRSPARPSITDNMPTDQRFPSQGGGILDVKCHQVYHVVRVCGKLCIPPPLVRRSIAEKDLRTKCYVSLEEDCVALIYSHRPVTGSKRFGGPRSRHGRVGLARGMKTVGLAPVSYMVLPQVLWPVVGFPQDHSLRGNQAVPDLLV